MENTTKHAQLVYPHYGSKLKLSDENIEATNSDVPISVVVGCVLTCSGPILKSWRTNSANIGSNPEAFGNKLLILGSAQHRPILLHFYGQAQGRT